VNNYTSNSSEGKNANGKEEKKKRKKEKKKKRKKKKEKRKEEKPFLVESCLRLVQCGLMLGETVRSMRKKIIHMKKK
jgi:hypothetical protein